MMMTKKKKLVIGGVSAAALVTAAVVAAAALMAPASGPSDEPVQTAKVTTRTIVTAIAGKGSIEAGSRATAAFRDGGTVIGIAVAVGQPVTAGQDLAAIDPAAADLAVGRAEDARWAAGNALDTARAQVTTAQNAVAAARAAVSAAPPDSPDLATLTAAVREAEGQVTSAQAAVVQATVQVNTADQDVTAAQATKSATVLKAPISGVVVAINGTIGSVTSGGGGGSGSDGGSASSGLIQIADTSKLVVTAQVGEADIATVAVDQKATVTLPSEGGVELAGKVTAVAPLPTSTDGVVKYPVTVVLTEVPPTVRLGLTAVVSITTQEAPDVLALPVDAVTLTSPTEGTVQVPDGKGKDPAKTRAVPVTVGLIGTEFVEIRAGLKKDDTVVLPSIALSPDGGDPGQQLDQQFNNPPFTMEEMG